MSIRTKPLKKIRRLFYDIETSPCLVLAFRTGYQVDINYDGIVEERKIICIGYKWGGDPKVTVLRWDKDKGDRRMLSQFIEIANEADELVAHFGDNFDLPWVRTRCLMQRLPALPLYKTIDTKALASKNFYFNSNKLDYISKVLGHGGKLKTDYEMWVKIMLHNDQKELNKMCKYCGVDVIKLEKIYDDMAPNVRPRTHAGVFAGLDKWSCSHCGSEDVSHSKARVSAGGTVQHQMQCRKCGSYHTVSQSSYESFIKETTKAS